MPDPNPRILALFGGAVLFGQERGNIEALSALRASGCEILCLVRDEAWHNEVPAALSARGIKYRRVPYIEQRLPGRLHYFLFRNPFAFLRANWQFWHIARQFRPTLIYAFNSYYVLNFLIGVSLLRTPVLYRAGDRPTLHNAFFRWLWSVIVRRTRLFVANSRFVQREVIATGAHSNKVRVIYNKPPWRREVAPFHLPPGLLPDGIRIAYVGQLIPDKGVHLLVDAFRSVASAFPNVTLLIAGRLSEWEGDAWARDLAARSLQDTTLRGRVFFLGFIEDPRKLLEHSHIHVCPSVIEESFANVVMEAKEAGVPSIVFPSGGLPEMIQHGVDGLICDVKTTASLVQAMRFYLQNPMVIEQHAAAARLSLERLNVHRFEESWRCVVEEAAS